MIWSLASQKPQANRNNMCQGAAVMPSLASQKPQANRNHFDHSYEIEHSLASQKPQANRNKIAFKPVTAASLASQKPQANRNGEAEALDFPAAIAVQIRAMDREAINCLSDHLACFGGFGDYSPRNPSHPDHPGTRVARRRDRSHLTVCANLFYIIAHYIP